MINSFLNHFAFDDESLDNTYLPGFNEMVNNADIIYLLENIGGKSFNNGIYRVHSFASSKQWTDLVKDAFPEAKNIWIFGYDWLGRQFGISLDQGSQISFFDIATNEMFNMPCNDIFEFHNVELVEYEDDALAKIDFEKWMVKWVKCIGLKDCVGYKIPLFLGGKDEFENYELVNTEVFWSLNIQIVKQINKLPPGTSIDEIKLR